MLPGFPDALTPEVDGPSAFLFRRGEDVSDGNAATLRRKWEAGPFPSSGSATVRLRDLHVGTLNLASGISFFQVQVQTEKCKVNTD